MFSRLASLLIFCYGFIIPNILSIINQLPLHFPSIITRFYSDLTELKPVDVITATSQLRVVKVGKTITVYLNGKQVTSEGVVASNISPQYLPAYQTITKGLCFTSGKYQEVFLQIEAGTTNKSLIAYLYVPNASTSAGVLSSGNVYGEISWTIGK